MMEHFTGDPYISWILMVNTMFPIDFSHKPMDSKGTNPWVSQVQTEGLLMSPRRSAPEPRHLAPSVDGYGSPAAVDGRNMAKSHQNPIIIP